MDEAIIQYVKRKHNLLVGERTAEIIKMHDRHRRTARRAAQTMEIKGRDLVAGIPKTIVLVNCDEIREALAEPINADRRRGAARRSSARRPSSPADIVDRGIVLVGGGALLRDFDQLLRAGDQAADRAQRRPVHRGRRGQPARTLDDMDLLRQVAMPG